MPSNNNTSGGRHFKSAPQQTQQAPQTQPTHQRSAGTPSYQTSPSYAGSNSYPGAGRDGYNPNAGAAYGTRTTRNASTAAGNGYASSYTNPAPGFDNEPENHGSSLGKKIGIGVLIAVLVLIAAGAALGASLFLDAKSIMSESTALIMEAKSMKDDLKSFDMDSLNTKATTLASKTSDMKQKTDGINWKIASFIPVLGDDIRAARGLVSEADNLMQNAMVPAASKLAELKPDKLLVDGAVNVESLQDILNTVASVTPTIRESITAIDSLPTPHIGKLASAIEKVKDPLDTAAPYLDDIDTFATELPRMLGANGETRNYLLVAQNNAELRSTGGLPGSMGIMTITDGKIEMGDFTATADLKFYETSGFGATDEEISIFGDRIGMKCNDSNFIPDWNRASHFIKSIYKDQVGGPDVDGVVGVDPVFLQSLLALTGGVESAGFTVDGTNAARMLMHDSYQTMDINTTDAFFAGVAGLAFKHIMSNLGSAGMGDLVSAVKDNIKQGHLMVSMTDETQQELIKTMGLDFSIKTDETEPELGVFPTDDTWSKISWYFSDNTNVGEGTKNADGTTTYHVTTTMTNNIATLTEANALVDYIAGYHPSKRDRADMYMPVYLLAPAGGKIENLQTSGGDNSIQPFTDATYNGNQLIHGIIRLDAGETMTLTYDVTVSAKATKTLAVRTSPTAQTAAGWASDPQVAGKDIESN